MSVRRIDTKLARWLGYIVMGMRRHGEWRSWGSGGFDPDHPWGMEDMR